MRSAIYHTPQNVVRTYFKEQRTGPLFSRGTARNGDVTHDIMCSDIATAFIKAAGEDITGFSAPLASHLANLLEGRFWAKIRASCTDSFQSREGFLGQTGQTRRLMSILRR
jgi:hypothetical protein